MSRSSFPGFNPSLFKFLGQLRRNNNRDWFARNKGRYEDEVLFPALAFVSAFATRLNRISPNFEASPRRVGGSVMRIYRDTRFSKDKTPYKTNVGIQFRHRTGRDVHCPGFYLHLDPDECFLGAGIWHPDNTALARIRAAIDENPAGWKKARDHKAFRTFFELRGDSLKRSPRDFPDNHPLIEDLKRKDFIGVAALEADLVCSPNLIDVMERRLVSSRPLMEFLCTALRVPF
jgi:uncharacterized protein (TIGR02453 family)